MTARPDIVWTRCEVCDEQVTTHKAVAIPAGYICGRCFTPRGQFPGTRCAILCTGPSVRGLDLSQITVPTIGVNWSCLEDRGGVQADIHVLSNIEFIKKHGAEFDKLTPGARFRISPMRVAGAFEPDRISVSAGIMSFTSYAGWNAYKAGAVVPPIKADFNLYREGWLFCGGGPQALQVAITFGFTDITFVGLDLHTGDTCHFYEDNPDMSERSGYSRAKLDKAWIIQQAYFKQACAGLEERGIRVRNIGRSGIFERGDWGDICG